AEVIEGNRLSRQGQVAQAAEHYKAAKDKMKYVLGDCNPDERAKFTELYLEALTNTGSTAADAGQFAEAQAAHNEAFQEAQKNHSIEAEADAALQLAEDYLMQGKTELALRFVKQTLKDLSDSPAMEKYHANLDIELAKCYKQLGQKDPAVRLVQDAI